MISFRFWFWISDFFFVHICQARRALRALKGIVLLQALIRGHSVRRQTTETLQCMQALVKAQARVRARQVRVALENQVARKKIPEQDDHENHVREVEVGNIVSMSLCCQMSHLFLFLHYFISHTFSPSIRSNTLHEGRGAGGLILVVCVYLFLSVYILCFTDFCFYSSLSNSVIFHLGLQWPWGDAIPFFSIMQKMKKFGGGGGTP